MSILIAVLVIAVIGGSIYWLRNDRFVIDSVNVSGASFSNPTQVQSVAMGDLAGNYLFVYPKASIYFYKAKKIEADILRDFPAVQTLTLSLQKNPASQAPMLAITVKERQPFALWCGESIGSSAAAPALSASSSDSAAVDSSDSSDTSGQCYFADSSGYIFSEAPHFSGTLYPIFYGGLGEASSSPTGTTTQVIGNSILTPSRLASVMDFAKNVGPIGFNVTSYAITEDPSGDICDLYYGTSTSSYLRIDCDGDFSDMATNLQAFITDSHFSSSTPFGYQYIDLRFGDKIVYKRK